MEKNPTLNASTPDNRLRSRITYRNRESLNISPISDTGSFNSSRNKSGSIKKSSKNLSDSSDSDSSNTESEDTGNFEQISENRNITANTSNRNIYFELCIVIAFTVLIYFCVCFSINSDENVICEIEEFKRTVPSYSNTWYAIENGIQEILNFNKPSVFVILYKQTDENDLDRFLKNVSEYSICKLGKQKKEPIVINGIDLNTQENLVDFGFVIHRYKDDLEEKGTMIIKNLDHVHGNIAQALHSFCDEYTPLVAKSLFIFTVKVDNFDGKSTKMVEAVLRRNWNQLDQDILEPLLTRITGMVLNFS